MAHSHTAIWKGKLHTNNLSGWSMLTGMSRTFIRTKLREGLDKGLPWHECMQYALEQQPSEKHQVARSRYVNSNVNKQPKVPPEKLALVDVQRNAFLYHR